MKCVSAISSTIFLYDEDQDDDKMCNKILDVEHMNFRKVSKEEIDRITIL